MGDTHSDPSCQYGNCFWAQALVDTYIHRLLVLDENLWQEHAHFHARVDIGARDDEAGTPVSRKPVFSQPLPFFAPWTEQREAFSMDVGPHFALERLYATIQARIWQRWWT